ncbi:ATP-binding protein [Desulfovibrio sp. JC022]|uniref:sensor histidine kinase n=1 Tax=Desulfovibrio sp. JC022 TaxID=2593642 RepID=UPI0013D22269|nr:ATP-binding protein [Desulfovibrio sp. JC022]
MLNKKLSGLLKEQITFKVLLLCLIFFMAFAVIFVVDRVQLNTLDRYDREISNQQARSELGKAIMHRLLMIELGVARMLDTTDLRKVEVINSDINHSLSKLGDTLTVLQSGGTFKNSFPANFYDKDKVDEQITFHREKGAGYAMEVIDLNPKVFELEEAIAGIYSALRKMLSEKEQPLHEKVHDALDFRAMQIAALILRARESSSKIFHETQIEIERLDLLKKQASSRMNSTRIAVLAFTLPVCLFLFFRILFNIRSILDDREAKSRNLEEAKLAIETILDSIPVGMAIVNERREVIKVNSEALRLFEADSVDKVLGTRCDKVFCLSSEDSCPFICEFEGPYVNEVEIKTATGRKITVLKNAAYITLSGERLILEAFMDISQRIEMEKRLKDQQDYTNAVLQGVQAGVVVIASSTHTIVDMNETAARIIGVNREDALGAVCHKYICPAEVGKCPVTDLGQGIDHAVRRLANGKSVLKTVVPFKRGGDSFLLESFVDVTDRISAEEQLKNALKSADSVSKAKTEFLSRMSHELRTPLNAIVGFSDIVLSCEDDEVTSKIRSHVKHIAAAGQHLLKMITEVLDFSMIESGNIAICLEPVTAGEIIQESTVLLEQQALECGVAIHVDSSVEDLPELNVDRTRFKQVLINLLSNGIKYNHEGGKVEISGVVRGNEVLLAVADTGIGIPESRHEDLFKPFSRFSDKEFEIEGTGIGLAISRQLIEAMGGSIIFSSLEGRGTTFTVTIPVLVAGIDDIVFEPDVIDSEDDLPTILFIEDDTATLEEFRGLVSGWGGCALIVRKTIAKGMRAVSLLRPDVVIVSEELAGEFVEGIIAEIREQGSGEWAPFIALLGSGSSHGADVVLDLPVTLEGLRQILMESKEK